MNNIKDKNQDKKSSIAIIILAAGASRRMGQPKQLLPYRGKTLLSYVIDCAIANAPAFGLSAQCQSKRLTASTSNPVIVILGANANKIEPRISQFPIKIVKNINWNEGISSSISCGVNYVQEQYPNIDGVIFLTCDQPFISTEIINQLVAAYNLTNKPIIASHYEKTLGIPALFSSSFFSELIELKGDSGAKKIINKYPELVKKIDFPQGKIDLDTLEKYQQLIFQDATNH